VALHDTRCSTRASDGNCKAPANDSVPGGVIYIALPGTKAKLCEGLAPAKSSTRLCAGLGTETLNQRVHDVGLAAFNALNTRLVNEPSAYEGSQ
jgi:hypothetical protein